MSPTTAENNSDSGVMGIVNSIIEFPDRWKAPWVRIAFSLGIAGIGAIAIFAPLPIIGPGFPYFTDFDMITAMRLVIGVTGIGIGFWWASEDAFGYWRKEGSKVCAVAFPIFAFLGGGLFIGTACNHGVELAIHNGFFYAGLNILPLGFFGLAWLPNFERRAQFVQLEHSEIDKNNRLDEREKDDYPHPGNIR
jgi:hypothetical protein